MGDSRFVERGLRTNTFSSLDLRECFTLECLKGRKDVAIIVTKEQAKALEKSHSIPLRVELESRNITLIVKER